MDVQGIRFAAADAGVAPGEDVQVQRVRVWDITLAPGERLPFHCHRTSYFLPVRGRGPLPCSFSGWVVRGQTVIHDLTNVADTVLRFTTVELLDGR